MKWMKRITLLVALGLLPPSMVTAADREASNDYVTVRELMRMENEYALRAARERIHPAHNTNAAAVVRGSMTSSAPEAPRLVGIFGVGKRLFAEVRAGSQAWLFLKGHRQPVGYTAVSVPYRLRDIAGACVRLDKQGEETVLCLDK